MGVHSNLLGRWPQNEGDVKICLGSPQQARLGCFSLFGGKHMSATRLLGLWLVLLLATCGAFAQKTPVPEKKAPATGAQSKSAPTVAEAEAFMKKAEAQLEDLGIRASRASWVQENFITDDTEMLAAQAQEKLTALVTQLALDARRFDGLKMPAELQRKFMLLKLSLV